MAETSAVTISSTKGPPAPFPKTVIRPHENDVSGITPTPQKAVSRLKPIEREKILGHIQRSLCLLPMQMPEEGLRIAAQLLLNQSSGERGLELMGHHQSLFEFAKGERSSSDLPTELLLIIDRCAQQSPMLKRFQTWQAHREYQGFLAEAEQDLSALKLKNTVASFYLAQNKDKTKHHSKELTAQGLAPELAKKLATNLRGALTRDLRGRDQTLFDWLKNNPVAHHDVAALIGHVSAERMDEFETLLLNKGLSTNLQNYSPQQCQALAQKIPKTLLGKRQVSASEARQLRQSEGLPSWALLASATSTAEAMIATAPLPELMRISDEEIVYLFCRSSEEQARSTPSLAWHQRLVEVEVERVPPSKIKAWNTAIKQACETLRLHLELGPLLKRVFQKALKNTKDERILEQKFSAYRLEKLLYPKQNNTYLQHHVSGLKKSHRAAHTELQRAWQLNEQNGAWSFSYATFTEPDALQSSHRLMWRPKKMIDKLSGVD